MHRAKGLRQIEIIACGWARLAEWWLCRFYRVFFEIPRNFRLCAANPPPPHDRQPYAVNEKHANCDPVTSTPSERCGGHGQHQSPKNTPTRNQCGDAQRLAKSAGTVIHGLFVFFSRLQSSDFRGHQIFRNILT